MTTTTTRAVAFTVHGSPAPQGSKRAFKHRTTGRIIVAEQQDTRVKAWRKAVADAWTATATDGTITGPVLVGIRFALPRPKAHYRSGRFAHELRDDAPRYPAGTPDLSKLARSTEDALTDAGAWADDALVVSYVLAKVYTDHPDAAPLDGRPGAVIEIHPLD